MRQYAGHHQKRNQQLEVARNPTGIHERTGLSRGTRGLPNPKIMVQEILAYCILAVAIFFLVRKFFWKKKKDKNCGNGDCGCH
jgi:hypothetical protein